MPLFCLFVLLTSLSIARAQPAPGDVQDTEAAREKILKASDQLDMIQANTESTKTELESMKAGMTKLQDDNTALKQQMAALQAAYDKLETDREKQNQVLIDEVSKMIASGKSAPSLAAKKKTVDAATETAPADSTPAEKPAETKPTANTGAETEAVPPPPAQKGYYHTVESGETVAMIVAAYRQQGVHVTSAQVRKANDLTEKSVLKTGQKLFIPKPGA